MFCLKSCYVLSLCISYFLCFWGCSVSLPPVAREGFRGWAPRNRPPDCEHNRVERSSSAKQRRSAPPPTLLDSCCRVDFGLVPLVLQESAAHTQHRLQRCTKMRARRFWQHAVAFVDIKRGRPRFRTPPKDEANKRCSTLANLAFEAPPRGREVSREPPRFVKRQRARVQTAALAINC